MKMMPNVSAEMLGMQDVWQRKLQHISRKVRPFLPGKTLAMSIDGFPVIISYAMVSHGKGVVSEKMLIAHSKDAGIVDEIIEEFRKNAIGLHQIVMQIQLHSLRNDAPFLSKAIRAGIVHVWSAFPIDDLFGKIGASIEGTKLITIRRDN